MSQRVIGSCFSEFPKASEPNEEMGENVFKEDESDRSKESTPVKASRVSSQDLNRIELPTNYNPLTALNQVEMLYNFFLKTSGKLPEKMDVAHDGISPVKQLAHLRRIRDIQVFGCLIAQIFAPVRCRILSLEAGLEEVHELALKILTEPNDIPKSLHHVLKLIFPVDRGTKQNVLATRFKPVTEEGLPPLSPHQMLQPLVDIISFPNYIPLLSAFITRLKEHSRLLQEVVYTSEDPKKVREASYLLAEKHVSKMERELRGLLPQLPPDGLKLLLPHVIAMYKNPASSTCVAWHLTDPLAQALGPAESRRHLLPLLVRHFEGDSMSDRHVKLFHHTFLLQLMARLGLKAFLKHFITPIIEGAGGYKAPTEGCRKPSSAAPSVLKQSKILR